jgi:sterol 3beta-glucosyltransferase
MIGSTVREPGKVDGVLSGTYQGVKGLFTGVYDGITGLVKEPMEGHKKEVSLGIPRGINLMSGRRGGFERFFART